MNFTAEHSNWLAVGEMIRLIQKPISCYVDHVVMKFHKKLCQDFDRHSKCTSKHCKKMTPSSGLCTSCKKSWLGKLKTSHKKGYNPSWSRNCDGAKWYDNHWEVAKFFMSALGNNRNTVKDAESTDLSSLLNALEWMKDVVFPGKIRVDVNLVIKLRLNVRNTWAHAPKHELSDQQKEDYFEIAANFLEDLKKVFPSKNTEIEQSMESLENLKANGVSDLVKSEIQILLLKSDILKGIKVEVLSLNEAQIKERESQLKKLESAMNECLQRMEAFQKLKENIEKQFAAFAAEIKSIIAIPDDLREIRESLRKISDGIANLQNVSKGAREEPKSTSCLQEKLPMFTAREDEVKTIISSLNNKEKEIGIVSLHGGPGFGKSALAVEVSHRLCDDNVVVIFSDLSTASNVSETIVQLCRDVGINPEEDPKSSLILWLRNIKERLIIVMDGIDELLAEDQIHDWYDFIRLLRKSSNQHCQIITTSRTEYEIHDISTANVPVTAMDENSSLALLEKRCPNLDKEFLRMLARLCGNIPLAMCIAASRVQDFNDPNSLLEHLKNNPIKTLRDRKTNQYVDKAINMSYEKLPNEQKISLVRLSVFKGNFREEAAQAVIEKDTLDTNNILKELVTRSLITKVREGQFSIHHLIRHFLTDQKVNEEQIATGRSRMVKHYLELCHTSTINSYSKNGFKKEREILNREAHNIEDVLKICTKPNDSGISNVLADSEIYKSSCRFFYNIVKTIISKKTVLEDFLQACADLARTREEWTNKINFECMLVDHERRKSSWNSDAYFKKMMATEKEFREYEEYLTEDVALQAYFFYQFGRYFLNQSKVYKAHGDTERPKHLDTLHSEAENYLCKSLELRNVLPESPLANADVILSLMQLGNLRKKIASYRNKLNASVEECERCNEQAQQYYKEAIELAGKNLGEHELTSACYKVLGDLLLLRRNKKTAMQCYDAARRMREQLNLNTSEEYVLLLNNIGRCLMFMQRYTEADEILNEALKLVEDDGPPVCKEKVNKSLNELKHRM